MKSHQLSTLLLLDSSASSSHDDEQELEMNRQQISDPSDIIEKSFINVPKIVMKYAKRVDSIWGAWFFFSFYFKPVLKGKSKANITVEVDGLSGFTKSDLDLDVFIVQHDMENIYRWVFKERPENALGKMQLRSFMNGHSHHQGDRRLFPFSVEKGFVRSHRMQRKCYRGLSNPQCVHGIELVQFPNLLSLSEEDKQKWVNLTGRDLNFKIPPEALDFSSWRNLSIPESKLEKAPFFSIDSKENLNSQKLLDGIGQKRKNFSHEWLNDFSGVMRDAYGPVTAAKTIYEDGGGYLIMVSLPFVDIKRVKVSWRNSLTNGIIKVSCLSMSGAMFVKRKDRTFKMSDPSPEHCPSGEFVREITLSTRIPENANIEAYYDDVEGMMLEILVPKIREGIEEHEVRVYPHSYNDLMLL
ncbi:uncharacterized protein LOC124931745 [Impatiens glandulifera]|uniref:uncharacterized protein LOC124931745 n=1 Tax=Impatiens glandulifera TaxID=253017 RepID=UPI001FB06C01|nr:uncharacterized protein LOC124931745 [Impatiens glandulifera]